MKSVLKDETNLLLKKHVGEDREERSTSNCFFMVMIMVIMVMGDDYDNDAAEGDGNVDNTVDDNTS